MTKKELINLLQSIYDKIPDCTCQSDKLVKIAVDHYIKPTCHRHAMFTESEINYIRITLNNQAIVGAVKVPDPAREPPKS